MNIEIIIEFAGLVLLLICSAFFSSAETAFFALNPIHVHRMRKSVPVRAQMVEDILSKPRDILSTLLIGNTVVNIVASGVGFAIASNYFREFAEAVAISVMTLLLLVFGEVAPKRLAMAKSETLARMYAPLLVRLVGLTKPLRWVLDRITAKYQKHLAPSGRYLTEEEYLTLVEVGEEEGVLDEEERTMVDGIISLEDAQASEVMTPRVDVVGIDLDDPAEMHEEIASKAMYRYIPVFQGSLDNAKGFLDVFRFLLSEDRNLNSAMIPPFFVPETMPLDNLFAAFQKEGRRIAFVVDEYGGTAGIITRGDILEEIIPDVEGEYREETLKIQPLGNRKWLVTGDVSLDDINYELELDLYAEGVDRISGWVIALKEALPKAGDTVESQSCRAIVRKVRRNRITLIELERLGEKK